MIYKIDKHFQGGCGLYYAKHSLKKRVRKGCWDYQLEEWGERTSGGHGYGYRIYSRRVKNIPKGARLLKFNKYYLENVKKAH